MKKTAPWLLGGLIVLLLVMTFEESRAGMVIHQVMRDRDGRVSNVVLSGEGERLRSDDLDGGLTTVMDFKGDRLVMIDHRSKRYVETKFSRWEKEVAERLKKELPGITPKRSEIIVRKTGETAVINGFRTEKIDILADGELIEENWMTREVALGDLEKAMERASKGFSREFRSGMEEGREIYEKLKPHGFSILVKDYTIAYGLGINVLEVRKIEQKTLEEDLFLAPKGYERILVEAPKK